jgi:hypothetical protein
LNESDAASSHTRLSGLHKLAMRWISIRAHMRYHTPLGDIACESFSKSEAAQGLGAAEVDVTRRLDAPQLTMERVSNRLDN